MEGSAMEQEALLQRPLPTPHREPRILPRFQFLELYLYAADEFQIKQEKRNNSRWSAEYKQRQRDKQKRKKRGAPVAGASLESAPFGTAGGAEASDRTPLDYHRNEYC